MTLCIETSVECAGWSALEDLDALVAECLRSALEESGDELVEGVEVSLLFCDDSRIQGLNRNFRGQDKPTNVLSFPSPDSLETARFIGDIAVAYETVAREAEAMETMEIHILRRLGVDNPYRDDEHKEILGHERA
jgi:probable rRNA maturation factor